MVVLDICVKYLKEQYCDKHCQCLHICRLYILSDNCNTKRRQSNSRADSSIVKTCHLTHKLLSPHNYAILKTVQAIQCVLEDPENEILKFVRKYIQNNRTRNTVPWVCVSTSAAQCTRGAACQRLHVCFNYVMGSCKDHCRKQLHNVTCHSNKQLLAAYAIDGTYEKKARETLAELYEELDIKKYVCKWTNKNEFTRVSSDNNNQNNVGSVSTTTDTASSNYSRDAVNKDAFGNSEQSNQIAQKTSHTNVLQTHTIYNRMYNRMLSIRDANVNTEEHGHVELPTTLETEFTLTYEKICIDFFLGMCSFERDCPCYHSYFPYQWQWLLNNEWITFDKHENALLEKNYCDPKIDSLKIYGAKVSFLDMTMEKCNVIGDGQHVLILTHKIKRLSTPSSARQDIIKKAEKYYTTWCWYERTGIRKWKLQDLKASSKLEARFQVDRNSPFSYQTADGHHHRVNFRSMSMTATVRGQDKRHLKRRPTCLDLCEDQAKSNVSSICISHLTNNCSDEETCSSMHCIRPFQWEYNYNDAWTAFEDHENVQIEKAYCSLKKSC